MLPISTKEIPGLMTYTYETVLNFGQLQYWLPECYKKLSKKCNSPGVKYGIKKETLTLINFFRNSDKSFIFWRCSWNAWNVPTFRWTKINGGLDANFCYSKVRSSSILPIWRNWSSFRPSPSSSGKIFKKYHFLHNLAKNRFLKWWMKWSNTHNLLPQPFDLNYSMPVIR